MPRLFDLATASLPSGIRVLAGIRVGALGPRPAEPLQLFEFEGCPYCRKVREAASVLDLTLDVFPCPKGGTRFRDRAVALSGKLQFPFLVNPNTDTRLLESADIVRYLFARYGTGAPPWWLGWDAFATTTSAVACAARPTQGMRARPSRAPAQPLELWSFEASPYCRLVRERMCELELPYRLHNVAKGSPSRPDFVARSGKMMVPYLADPNTGRAMHESADILAYLDAEYGAA